MPSAAEPDLTALYGALGGVAGICLIVGCVMLNKYYCHSRTAVSPMHT